MNGERRLDPPGCPSPASLAVAFVGTGAIAWAEHRAGKVATVDL